ncbi:hypothetical protein L3Y34_017956 [Caenorhabditis briggsae]|uniref:Uncharacterized protein n=1 Tax=Caenorhabditis briggsae TaxID=6238 RepID=A0AAE9ITT9_CAEBR|nr:hypothetical protein L3Y34_017956 [Caenorhabditis briggsae]
MFTSREALTNDNQLATDGEPTGHRRAIDGPKYGSILFFSLFRRVPSTLSTLPQKSTNGFSRGLSGARGRRRGWQLAQNGLYPSIARIIRLFVSWFIRPTARSIYEFIGSMTTCTTHSKHVPSDAVITFTIG